MCTLALLALPTFASAANLPRYKLQPGQVLTYIQQINLGERQTFKAKQLFIVCSNASTCTAFIPATTGRSICSCKRSLPPKSIMCPDFAALVCR